MSRESSVDVKPPREQDSTIPPEATPKEPQPESHTQSQPQSQQHYKQNDSQNNHQAHVAQVPMMVPHYPPHGPSPVPYNHYQPYQQVPYPPQAQYYHSQHQPSLPVTPNSAPMYPQGPPSQGLPQYQQPPQPPSLQHQLSRNQPQLPPDQSNSTHQSPAQHQSPSNQQFHTPQRTMAAPPVPLSGSAKKHQTPISTPESQRKKQRRSDHSLPGEEGDQDLKDQATKALQFPLGEVAAEVRSLEASNTGTSSTITTNTPNGKHIVRSDNHKERKKQIFAMTWLLRACEGVSNSVVPRNRIYARYVGVCADNGIKPLSPASFGKLVRIAFPNLTTRRLGMRGQSKYHYCGLRLVGDDGSSTPITSSANTPLHNHSLDASFLPGTPYGDSNSPASFHSQLSTPLLSNSTTNINNVAAITNFLNENVTPNLKFLPNLLELINDSTEPEQPLELPELKPYLPPSTDLDVADTLYGLYKSHCTSIFESLRYLHLRKLFSLLSSFHTSLTTPVIKLYSSPEVLPWILQCDLVMYKTILKMLGKLVLQEIPSYVLQQLKQVAATYSERVSNSLNSMPIKLVLGKLKLAKQFSQLVSRLVRVSETSQTASKILSNEIDRGIMYNDWVNHVNIEQIALKELPCDAGENHKKAVNILKNKTLELLKLEPKEGVSILNEWGLYISQIPQQFEDLPPRLLLLCTSTMLTSALREVSLAGGAGFGAWWVLRCWIDEWIGWCAELGGFLTNSIEAGNLEQGPLLETTIKAVQKAKEESEKKDSGDKSNKKVIETKDEAEVDVEVEGEDESKNGKSVDLLDGQFGGFINKTEEEKNENENE